MKIIEKYNVEKISSIVDPRDNVILIELYINSHLTALHLSLDDANVLKKELVNAIIVLRDRLGVQEDV